jgi:hypothetical protein
LTQRQANHLPQPSLIVNDQNFTHSQPDAKPAIFVPATEECTYLLIKSLQIFKPAISGTLIDGNVMIQRIPHIDLAGSINAAFRLFHDLFIIGNPARHPPDGKNDREHLHWNTNGPHDDSAVKIDVRVQFALNKIGILQGRLLQFFGNVQ